MNNIKVLPNDQTDNKTVTTSPKTIGQSCDTCENYTNSDCFTFLDTNVCYIVVESKN